MNISGMHSLTGFSLIICIRGYWKISLSLKEAFTQARSLELAQNQSQLYLSPSAVNAVVKDVQPEQLPGVSMKPQAESTIAAISTKCFFYGRQRMRGKKGHFVKVCRNSKSALEIQELLNSPACLKKAAVDVTINYYKAYGLIDTGSSARFINEDTIRKLKVPVLACKGEKVSMASTFKLSVKGQCVITLCLRGHKYKDITVSIRPDLCSDIIVGHDILKDITFGGKEALLDICDVAAANVEPAYLFTHLSPNCKPISIKSHGIQHQIYNSLILKNRTC
ncbi:hypothetical protein PR048_004319 [Dryococelus australis]|uniref:Peptidase A2 domain-containing protein n=1 Tax=Dryococelus australis TaxID=614101 RepID=A0ABQ9I549_9NEOP|nr:hypothetical protein PR048_004319 [Dryococelus australis]